MLEFYFKTKQDELLRPLEDPCRGCWVHADEASPEDLEQISYLTGLELEDLHDALDRYEVPRVEKTKQHVLIFTRHPTEQEIGLYTSTLTLILTDNYFVTIAPQKSHLLRHFLLQPHYLATEEHAKLLVHLLLKITHEFTTQTKKIHHGVLKKQEKELDYIDSEDIIALTKSEEILNQYFSTLKPLRNVLEAITSRKYTHLYEKDRDLIEDLMNAVKQSEELCSTTLKSIRSLRNSYQIIFTNNLNKTIKLLTALTIIFSIPTMIASFYGMNVSLPFAQNPYAFYYILLLIGISSVFALAIFQRKKWL